MLEPGLIALLELRAVELRIPSATSVLRYQLFHMDVSLLYKLLVHEPEPELSVLSFKLEAFGLLKSLPTISLGSSRYCLTIPYLMNY